MKIGFLAGWLLFCLAFLSAAMDIQTQSPGLLTSAEDLLLTYIPAKWIIFKSDIPGVLLDFVVLPLVQLPGWALFGVPAGALLWTCRPHREEPDEAHLESLGTFDRLVALAEEEKAPLEEPEWRDVDDLHVTQMDSVEPYVQDWTPGTPESDAPQNDK